LTPIRGREYHFLATGTLRCQAQWDMIPDNMKKEINITADLGVHQGSMAADLNQLSLFNL